MNRALRYVNAVIGIALIAALAALYWYAWRPMPQTSGTVTADVSREVMVGRDALGVPHIRASSIEDALFAQGYVTAQDRLWQMDAIRRAASGELAEVLGAGAVDSDRESRSLRIRRASEQHAATLSAADKAHLAAYARGVNELIDQSRNKLPLEFRLLKYKPRPWSIADSIAIAMYMHRTLTTTWNDDLYRYELARTGDASKVAALFPIRTGRETMAGSNAWVLAGSRTSSGKPILANDPHLEFAFPATWYQVHLQGGALNVTGVSLPGMPGVIIGHNQRIAWGMTNLGYDVQDLYLEKFDTTGARYAYQGAAEPSRAETEIISVQGASPVRLTNLLTRHGAVKVRQGSQIMSMRWTATETGKFEFPIVELNLAQNWQQFRAALRRYPGPGQNLVYADVDGNIGYQATGYLPLRKTFDGDLPVDGSTGAFEWEGYIPFDDLPSIYNPKSGLIVTANQNPWPSNSTLRLSGQFAPPYRSSQIQARLLTKQKWTPQEMLAIQTDVYSAFLHRLGSRVSRAYESGARKNSMQTGAVQQLKQWNGQVESSSSAALVTVLTFQHMRRILGERVSPAKGATYADEMAPAVVEAMLERRPRDWFPDWDAKLLEAFSEGVEEAARMQGRDPGKWRWGAYLQLTLPHPIFSQIPWAGPWFRLGPTEMQGHSTTVKQTTRRLGPSMRFIADLAKWDDSWNNITVGQSGHPFSSHFKDQWKSYLAGTSFPMQFDKVEAKEMLTLAPASR